MFRSVVVILFFVLATGSSVNAQETRVWKNKSGKFKIEATFIAATDDSVQIRRKDNGKTISVKLAQLSDDDLKYVKRLTTKSDGPGMETKTEKSDTSGAVSIDVLDDQTVKLVPYGKLPNFGPTFQWVIEKEDPVRVVAMEPASGAESQPGDFKKVTVEVLPPCSVKQRVSLIKSVSDEVSRTMQSDNFRLIESSTSTLDAAQEIKDTFIVSAEGFAGARVRAGSVIFFRFQKDKTILVQCYVKGGTTASGDALQVASKVDSLIMKDKGWLSKSNGTDESESGVPKKVRSEVEAKVAQILKLIEKDKIRELLAELMPKEVKDELFADEDELKKVIDTFKKFNAKQLKEELSNLQWEFATYSAEEQSVSFSNTTPLLKFTFVDGKWTMR